MKTPLTFRLRLWVIRTRLWFHHRPISAIRRLRPINPRKVHGLDRVGGRWLRKPLWRALRAFENQAHAKVFLFRPHPLVWLSFAGFGLGIVLLAVFPADNTWFGLGKDTNPNLIPKEQTVAVSLRPTAIAQRAAYSHSLWVRSGERLTDILSTLIIPKEAREAINHYRDRTGHFPRGIASALHRHQRFSAHFNDKGEWISLDINVNRMVYLRLSPTAKNTLTGQYFQHGGEWLVRYGLVTIEGSLFGSLERAGIPDSVGIKLADILGSELDFSREVKKGDTLSVIYRVLYMHGQIQPDIIIEALRYQSKSKTLTAFRYPSVADDNNLTQPIDKPIDMGNKSKIIMPLSATSKDNDNDEEAEANPRQAPSNIASGYFNMDGQSVVKGFLRNPMEFSRITSSFTTSRFHPVLHKMRAHNGVDYAAPIGTKVRSVADGVVNFMGIKGGYGNTIVLQHGNGIETRYAHLSGFAEGIKLGAKVVQTQTIGFVGKSGLASGPHLHFEFLVGGRHHNPLTVSLPVGKSLSPDKMLAFRSYSQTLITELDNAQKYASTNYE